VGLGLAGLGGGGWWLGVSPGLWRSAQFFGEGALVVRRWEVRCGPMEELAQGVKCRREDKHFSVVPVRQAQGRLYGTQFGHA
jgi:hypothetical protein